MNQQASGIERARPSKEAMRALPRFAGLAPAQICVVQTASDVERARSAIVQATQLGFDTESKPQFVAGRPANGPHLVQIATADAAFLFRPEAAVSQALLAELIASASLVKVGFGLDSDRAPLERKLGVVLRGSVDLARALRQFGYRQPVGLQTAVAIVLGRYLPKSRKITTSNWAARTLSAAQQSYAADDAYASLCVHVALARQARAALPKPA
ncbi:3'-5' exonuclease domain-containing protein 2 [Corticibacter populi]|uniref:3'-5' exonuclease domain-containing protein 2 n=1 Tax=Corticibacter populi TaxID=1550736 RepID=A0A3M6QTI4_9BURK|nr:3'-5' exonuclease [Corticibacter populi]RMX05869.1 3'-5' exonuclease domain-containing protein 2 [Corticibacter populi]RZS30813.1 3'-5' exonuclease [Corticibacter populi]